MAVNVAELAVKITTDGVAPAAADLKKVERAGAQVAKGLGGPGGTSPAVQSLIFSFNGMAASSIGVSQSLGTLFANVAPLFLSGPVTAGVLIGVYALGKAFKLFGGDAKQAAADAVEATKKVQAALDDLQNAGDVAGLRKKAKTLYEGTAAANFRDGITSLRSELAPLQEQYELQLSAGATTIANRLKAKIDDLNKQLKPKVAEFEDIKRRILAPGPSLERAPAEITVTGTRPRSAAEAARAAKRDADAERRARLDGTLQDLRDRGRIGVGLTYDAGFEDIQRARRQAAELGPGLERSLAATLRESGERVRAILTQQSARAQLFDALRTNLADGIRDSVVDGVGAGFTAAFASGSLGAGFQALTGTLLGGLGDSVLQFGVASLKAAFLMDGLLKSLANLLPGGAVVRATAMIALGAGLKAVAGRAFGGGRGGASGGSGGAYGGAIAGGYSGSASAGVVDRGVIAGAFGGTGGGAPAALPAGARPTFNHIVLIGPDDGAAQRDLFALLNNGAGRGLRLDAAALAAA